MSYRRYAAERILASLAILFVAASLAFLLFHVVGIRGVIRPDTPPDEVARYHRYERQTFGDYLWQLVGHGSLGVAVYGNFDLTHETFTHEAPVTLSVAEGTVVFAFLVGAPLGLAWSRRPRIIGPVAALFVHLALALWTLVVGLMLSFWLGYQESLLPIADYCNFFGAGQGRSCGGPDSMGLSPDPAVDDARAPPFGGLHGGHAEVDPEHPMCGRQDGCAPIRVDRRIEARASKSRLAGRRQPVRGDHLQSARPRPGDHPSGQRAGSCVCEAIVLTATIVAVTLVLVVDLVAAAIVPEWREPTR